MEIQLGKFGLDFSQSAICVPFIFNELAKTSLKLHTKLYIWSYPMILALLFLTKFFFQDIASFTDAVSFFFPEVFFPVNNKNHTI